MFRVTIPDVEVIDSLVEIQPIGLFNYNSAYFDGNTTIITYYDMPGKYSRLLQVQVTHKIISVSFHSITKLLEEKTQHSARLSLIADTETHCVAITVGDKCMVSAVSCEMPVNNIVELKSSIEAIAKDLSNVDEKLLPDLGMRLLKSFAKLATYHEDFSITAKKLNPVLKAFKTQYKSIGHAIAARSQTSNKV